MPGRIPHIEKWDRIHDIALGEMDYQEIADKYGLTVDGVDKFAARFRSEIQEHAAKIAQDRYAGIYNADPRNRVLDQDEDIRLIRKRLHAQQDEIDMQLRMVEVLAKLRRGIAEERGHLRTKVDVEAPSVTHILGVDLKRAGLASDDD